MSNYYKRSGRLETSVNYGNRQYRNQSDQRQVANSNRYASQGNQPQQQHSGQVGVQARLPKGWRRYIDEKSQVEYYWNEINAESTWSFPTMTAAEWIRSGQGSSISITGGHSRTSESNHYSHDGTDNGESYNYSTHSARPAVEVTQNLYNDNHNEYGTDDDNQSVGWNSDRGYYEDENEFSDPYNKQPGYSAYDQSYHDDSSYNYNYSNSSYQQHDNQDQAEKHRGYASSSKYVLPPRPMTGSYYGSTTNSDRGIRTMNRYGQRRNSNSKFRPSPPPGRKGKNHATHFQSEEALALPPKQKPASTSSYVIPSKNGQNRHEEQLPTLNNNQLDEQQGRNTNHFNFDHVETYGGQKRINRSLSMLGKELFKDSSKVEIGDYISVLYNERWCIARVLDFKDSEVPWVQVEIEGNPNVAEWIDFTSNRLKPFGAEGALSPARTHLKVLSKRFSLADYVEVKEKQSSKDEKLKAGWKIAQIVAIDVDGSVTVQYEGVNGVLGNEKIIESDQKARMRTLGESKSPKNSKKKSPSGPLNISEMKFRQKLKENGLLLEKMAPDGNCLFRAIAHQVYGDADKHTDLREACCNYMLSDGQKEHLENFVDGDFEKYVDKMRKPKTWGGNLEIEAMQEMFDRAIEIHSADSISDKTNKTTFKKDFDTSNTPETPRNAANEVNQPVPLRISYHGKSHYNSLVDPKNPPPLLPLESSRFQQRRKRRAIAVAKQAEEKKEEERKQNNSKQSAGVVNQDESNGDARNDIQGGNNNMNIEKKVDDPAKVNDNNEIKSKKSSVGFFGSIFRKSKSKGPGNSKKNENAIKLKPLAKSKSSLSISASNTLPGPESGEKRHGTLPAIGNQKLGPTKHRILKRASLSSPNMKTLKESESSLKMDSSVKNRGTSKSASSSPTQDHEGVSD